MKSLILCIVFFYVYQVQAQYSYSLTTLNQPYQNLSGATILSAPNWDFSFVSSINLGFSFPFFDQSFDSSILVMLGTLYPGVVGNENYQIYGFSTSYMISKGSGLSPVSYVITGSPGSKIAKVEWKNAGIDDIDTTKFVNVQIWLYQNGTIEFHYGPNYNITASDMDGTEIALIKVAPTSELLHVIGSPTNPSFVNQIDFLTSVPPNGTVYRFTKNITGVDNLAENEKNISVYPNPASNNITIQTGTNVAYMLKLNNLQGQTVIAKNVAFTNSYSLDLLGIANGIYFLTLQNEKEQVVRKVVVQK